MYVCVVSSSTQFFDAEGVKLSIIWQEKSIFKNITLRRSCVYMVYVSTTGPGHPGISFYIKTDPSNHLGTSYIYVATLYGVPTHWLGSTVVEKYSRAFWLACCGRKTHLNLLTIFSSHYDSVCLAS